MFNPFAKAEINIGRAGWLLIIEFLGGGALAVALEGLGFNSDLAMIFPWAISPFTAWFISKAAQAQGRNAFAYGLPSLIPMLSVIAFFLLYRNDSYSRISEEIKRKA